jgi:hypothetical protein
MAQAVRALSRPFLTTTTIQLGILDNSTVGGGSSNTAVGLAATVPGGFNNTANAAYTFAAGQRAKANHAGAFVWADSTSADFSSTGNDQFLIRAAGGVGIGTAPTSKLHLKVDASANPISAMSIDVQSFNTIPNAVNSHFLRVRDIGGGTTHFYIRGDGSVGIGTDSPDRTLSVNGTASKVGGGSWDTFSDERLKIIKGRFTPGLKAVMQLQPVRYAYKGDNALGIKAEGEHIGFGAQAVQQIIPEAVSRNDKGYLLVNNDPIMWTMLNAIKEQQQEIEQLKAELRQLKVNSRKHRRKGRS